MPLVTSISLWVLVNSLLKLDMKLHLLIVTVTPPWLQSEASNLFLLMNPFSQINQLQFSWNGQRKI
uniref:Uncharacterized protein n=1 Tax=Tetranychus urticae TaxID=32264 RepID=T1KVI1_TETUR